MAPQIQYAKTSDGLSIAYHTMGSGMPLLNMPFPFSHLQLEWEVPEERSWMQRLAEKWQLVSYDGRGRGLSDRDPLDFSMEANVRDMEAVLSRVGLERFAILAPVVSGQAGIAYAARHPERVTHLILWNSIARTTDLIRPQFRALMDLASEDWTLFTETMAHVVYGWSAGEPARRFAEAIRASVTPEWVRALLAAPSVDVTDLLPEVRSPTLVLHRRDAAGPSVDTARGLASRIPNARLVLLEGGEVSPWRGDEDAVFQAVQEFLSEGEETIAAPEASVPGALRTIVFTDVEGSTALTDRLGDAKARELLREHERITREALAEHGGSEVKTMGDGFMASFSSASGALECAIAIQNAFAERNESAEEGIKVRIGLNAGEPIAEDDPGGRGDLFGTAVNMAARIASKAEGGEILASNVVRELVAGKEFLFSDRGETELRGFEEAVRVYEVRWQE